MIRLMTSVQRLTFNPRANAQHPRLHKVPGKHVAIGFIIAENTWWHEQRAAAITVNGFGGERAAAFWVIDLGNNDVTSVSLKCVCV